jgi:hypothetical protein
MFRGALNHTGKERVMSNTNQDVQAHAADIAAALRSLKPNEQHRKNQLFSLLYPVIVEMLEQNVTQKAILKKLEEKGLKLHPVRFKDLMAEAKASSGEAGTEEGAA